MSKCPDCNEPVHEGWKLCPICGATLESCCRGCGERLEPKWKICPQCGTPAGVLGSSSQPNAHPGTSSSPVPASDWSSQPGLRASSSPQPPNPAHFDMSKEEVFDLSWSLRARAFEAFYADIGALHRQLNAGPGEESSTEDWLKITSPARFEQAYQNGIDAFASLLSGDTTLPSPLRSAADQIRSEKASLLEDLRPAGRELRDAAEAVKALNLPDGILTGFIQGAGRAANPTTGAGIGAMGGAALGTIIAPGIGTAIGGALGAMLGSSRDSKKDQAVLERYDLAVQGMYDGALNLFGRSWDLVVSKAESLGFSPLPQSTIFDNMYKEEATLRDDAAELTADQCKTRLASLLNKYGPSQGVLSMLVRCNLPPKGNDATEAKRWVDYSIRLYPNDPTVYENAADVALENGEAGDACELVEKGLSLDPESAGLYLTKFEALGASGAVEEAIQLEEPFREGAEGDRTSTIYLLRGLMRAGLEPKAAQLTKQWITEDRSAAVVGNILRSDSLLSPLVEKGLVDVPIGIIGELKGIVEAALWAEEGYKFFGPPPGDKQMNAANAGYYDLLSGEKVLWFWDWSFWGNAKTGFALTNKRIFWKCVWEDPVKISLDITDPNSVHEDSTYLVIGSEKVNVDTEIMAQTLASVIVQVIDVVRSR